MTTLRSIDLDVAGLTAAVRTNPNVLRNGALAVAVPAEWQGLVDLQRAAEVAARFTLDAGGQRC